MIAPQDDKVLYMRLTLYICLLTLANMLFKKQSSNKKMSKKSSHHKNLKMKNIMKNTKIIQALFSGLFLSVHSPAQYLDLSKLSKNQDTNSASNNVTALANGANINATLLPNIVITSDQSNQNNNGQDDDQDAFRIVIPRKKAENQNIEYQPCFSPRNRKDIAALQQYESNVNSDQDDLHQTANETVKENDSAKKRFNNQTLNDDESDESESDSYIADYLSPQPKSNQTTRIDSQSKQSDHKEEDEIELQEQNPESKKNTPTKSTSEEANHSQINNNTENNNTGEISNNSSAINISTINNQNIVTVTRNNHNNSIENNNTKLQQEHTQSSSAAQESNKKTSDKKPLIDIIKRDHIPMHKIKEHLKEYSITEILETVKFINDYYTLERFLALTSVIDSVEHIKLIFDTILLEESNKDYPNIQHLLPKIFHSTQDTARQTAAGILKLKITDKAGKKHYDYDSILKILNSLSSTFSACFISKRFDFSSNPEQERQAYSQFLTKLKHKASDNSVFKQTLKQMIEENEAKKQRQQQQSKKQEKICCCC